MTDRAGDGWLSGLVLGAMAGAVGVYAMDQVAHSLYRRAGANAIAAETAVRPGGLDPAHVIADRVTKAAGMELANKKDNTPAMVVHYALGVVPAAVYGALRDRLGFLGAVRGLLFGFTAFVVEDEIAGPRLGVTAPPAAFPWQTHGRGLVAHLAFGAATDAALRVLKGPPA